MLTHSTMRNALFQVSNTTLPAERLCKAIGRPTRGSYR